MYLGHNMRPYMTYLPGLHALTFRPTCKNNNMADQVEESSSFHEMGLDDRLVKVTNIFAIL